MTRDEAVKWLERIKERYILCGDEGFDKARKEALNMAIEALDKPIPKPHESLMHLLAVLDSVSPIEALECKSGEWQVYYDEDSPQDGIWKCSICGYIRLIDDISPTNYCPNCGADMRDSND